MRDATRGGLGAVLCELAAMTGLGVAIHENRIPINDSVAHVCELFGFDPLFVANEGKIVATAPREQAQQALAALHAHPCGARAAIIGALTSDHPGAVHMKTGIGGSRIIDTPAGAQLPRIC
jgi:hydrogenase expression/formation protein HypE